MSMPQPVALLVASLLWAVPMTAMAQPTSVEASLEEAKVLYRDGRIDDAIVALRAVISQLDQLRDIQRRRQHLSEAHFHLGLAYFALRDESRALENFRQVAALDPDRALDAEVYSPRVRDLFDRARSEVGAPRPSVADAAAARPEPASSPGTDPLSKLQPGTRVRLSLSKGEERVRGNLLSVTDTTLNLVGDDSQNMSFTHPMVTKVEIMTGRKRHWLMGLILGTAAGAIGGAFETPGCGGNDGDCYTRKENIGYAATGLGLVGSLVGALYTTERWADVTLERSSSSSTPAGDRRLAVSIGLRY